MNLVDSLHRAAAKLRHSDPSLAAELLLGAKAIEQIPRVSNVTVTYPATVAEISHTAERLMGFEPTDDPADPAAALIRAGQRVTALGEEVGKLVDQYNDLRSKVEDLRS